MKKISKNDILKLADKSEEEVYPEEIKEYYENNIANNLKNSGKIYENKYKEFYDDIKTKPREDW